MASSAGHVPKVPQALFLTRRAMKNRPRSYFPKGDHMLFGILRQEAGLCQALYWILAPVQAVCVYSPDGQAECGLALLLLSGPRQDESTPGQAGQV